MGKIDRKYIALDVGDARIGVARSDTLGMFANPLEVIHRKKTEPIERVRELCIKEKTKKVVVGIPKSLDGTEKVQAEKVRAFIKELEDNIEGIEIIEVDERLSTVSADKMLMETTNKDAKGKREVVDKIAASIILQTYLDMKR